MYCRKCGNSVLDTAKFCPKCGSPLKYAEETDERTKPGNSTEQEESYGNTYKTVYSEYQSEVPEGNTVEPDNEYFMDSGLSLGVRAKAVFSVVFVALAVISIIPAIIIYNSTEGRGWALLVFAILFFGIAGFPWGWSIFWPFWRDHLFGVSFNIFHFHARGSLLSIVTVGLVTIIFELAFFIAKWVLLPALCLAFGWISMLLHVGTIFSSFTSANTTG